LKKESLRVNVILYFYYKTIFFADKALKIIFASLPATISLF